VAQQEFDPYELLDALRAGGDVDLSAKASVEAGLQALVEAEATAVIGAGCQRQLQEVGCRARERQLTGREREHDYEGELHMNKK
jgi:hypothetical protein